MAKEKAKTGRASLAGALGRINKSKKSDTASLNLQSGQYTTTFHCDELTPDPLNPRRSIGTDALDELKESIAEKGQTTHVLVHTYPDGTNMIKSGHRRHKAISALHAEGRHDGVVLVLMEPDEQKANIARDFTENSVEALPKIDLALLLKRHAEEAGLWGKPGCNAYLHKVSSWDKSKISELMAIFNFHPIVVSLIADKKVYTPKHQRALNALSKKDEQDGGKRLKEADKRIRAKEPIEAVIASYAEAKPKKKVSVSVSALERIATTKFGIKTKGLSADEILVEILAKLDEDE